MLWSDCRRTDSAKIYVSAGIGKTHQSLRKISKLSILFTVRVKVVYRIEPLLWPSDLESVGYGQG